MFYLKNVPVWERALRVVASLMALAFTVLQWRAPGFPWAVLIGLMGAVLALTGAIGFCPLCAMLGRRLNQTP